MLERQIIAILRGIHPSEAPAIGAALLAEGITRIEVPLNSPDPLDSIRALITAADGRGVIGAGTVLSTDQVTDVAATGARLIVSPDCNPDIIAASVARGLESWPGVMTPTEAFTALRHGATGLKLFPGSLIGPEGLQALRAVLPASCPVLAVGGAGPANFAAWRASGASGFGIGTALYRPGDSAADVAGKARAIVAAYDAVM